MSPALPSPPAAPTLESLADTVASLSKQLEASHTALNMVWTLVAVFLIMFMQCGFALVESGLTRAKNVAHTMAMNFFVYAIGILGFWAVGFGLEMGGAGALGTLGGDATLSSEMVVRIAGHELGLFGTKGFFLSPAVLTPAVATIFLFQMVFMDTAATIPTGAMAERWRFSAFAAFSVAMSTIVFPIYGNWVWGGGWLSSLGKSFGLGHGHVDFAGGSAVHMVGGVAAFLGAKLLGPRLGKFAPDGSARPIPGHNMVLVVVGTFVLAFGWFGFNAGSTLSGHDARIAIVAANTMLASGAGAVGAFVYTKLRFGRPDLSMLCNGMLAGLVAITAPCAFVGASTAVAIGFTGGILVIVSTVFVENTLKVDDPVGAVSVHAVCGAWGILALGLFADGSYGEGWNGVAGPVRGLFYGDPGQLVAQGIGIVSNLVWVGVTVTLALKLIEVFVGNRSAAEDELGGLDVAELGMPGYSDEQGNDVGALPPIAAPIARPAPAPPRPPAPALGSGAYPAGAELLGRARTASTMIRTTPIASPPSKSVYPRPR